ncbi:scn4aa [Symbiodinium sp. CCMP2456]|nr:scn4aa [Symbiodinium sp. CCMP2456]
MGLIIVFNIGLIMYEADLDARCYPGWVNNYDQCPYRSDAIDWLNTVNISLLIAYTAECFVRFFVEHLTFFCNRWNMIDLTTVLLGWASVLLAGVINLSLLRLSRLIRVLRAIRVLISVPEFYLLVTGLFSAIKAILFGMLLLLVCLVFWAVIAVEMFHPHVSVLGEQVLGADGTKFPACTRCERSFETVFAASVTLFQQIVAGDAWGQINIPLVEEAPWLVPVVYLVMITISLGIMNLILAVIVERASEARENDHDQKIKKKDEERAKNMVELAVLCANLDKDQSGTVSLEEMRRGYDNVGEFKRLMQHMDIKKDEMELIFRVLDEDKDGNLSYLEFCKNLGSFFRRDPVIMHSLVQCSLEELKQVVKEEVVALMKQQHAELMAGLGLTPGKCFGDEKSPPTPSASPLGQAPEALLRAPVPWNTLKRIEAELEPLLVKAETIAAELDTSSISADVTEDWADHGPELNDAAKNTLLEAPSGDREQPVARSQQGPGFDEQFEHLHESFKLQAEKAELLQSRIRTALHYLSTAKGGGGIDAFHSKLFVV